MGSGADVQLSLAVSGHVLLASWAIWGSALVHLGCSPSQCVSDEGRVPVQG